CGNGARGPRLDAVRDDPWEQGSLRVRRPFPGGVAVGRSLDGPVEAVVFEGTQSLPALIVAGGPPKESALRFAEHRRFMPQSG
ncbi:MAG: hypothetical protein OXM03_10995, partial [Chloroflexota bacterium]|nr:hypothetical protein [Chloroflexota bacterium]